MSAQLFIDMAVGYRSAKAVMVAVRHGIFDTLAEGPRTPEALARALGFDATATAQLLGALGAVGALVVEDGGFRPTELAMTHLVRGRPGYIGHALQFADMLWDSWSHLGDTLHTGRPHELLPELLAREDRGFTGQYIRGMHHLAQKPARELAELLWAHPPRSMLDVGGGPGAYSVAMLEQFPATYATLLDLPSTLAIARELAGDHPRLRYREGNYLERASYGAEHDLVLMSHVTHDESPDRVAQMLRHAFDALLPGGRVVIHDWVVDDTGTTPKFAALFSLHVMLYTDGGRVYRESEYRRMLDAAGFVDSESFVISADAPNPTTAIVAYKPCPPAAQS